MNHLQALSARPAISVRLGFSFEDIKDIMVITRMTKAINVWWIITSFKDGLVIVVVIGEFPLLNFRKLGATSTNLEYCLTDTNYTISFSRGKASISKTQNPEAKRAKNTFNCASWLLIRLSHQEIAILVCKM